MTSKQHTHSMYFDQMSDNCTDNAIGYTYLTNATYHEALEACSNLSATIFNPRDYNPALLSKVLKSRKTETIWTPIWREFIWQKLNGT